MATQDELDQRAAAGEATATIEAPIETTVPTEATEAREAVEPSEAARLIFDNPKGAPAPWLDQASGSTEAADNPVTTGLPKSFTSVKGFKEQVNGELDADEAAATERRNKVSEQAGDTPVLSQLAKAGAWLDEKETEVADGALRGAVDMGAGAVDLATTPPKPEDLGKLTQGFDKPIDLQHAVGNDPDVMINGLKHTGVGKAISDGKYGDALGQAGIQVAGFFVGGELGEAEELAETPEVVPDVVPDTVPDVVPEVAPESVPDLAPDTIPSDPELIPDGPATQRSPIGPPVPSTPTPEVPVVDPPAYTPDELPPTVPTRLLPGGKPPAPAVDVPAVEPVPDTTPTPNAPSAPSPNTLRSEYDPNKVPSPGEQVEYPPHGGADGAWSTREVPQNLDRYGSEGGRYLSPEGAPLEQRSLAPVYDPEAAKLMGRPPNFDVGPKEYGVYTAKPGLTAPQSPLAPAFAKPGGATQIFTGTDPERGIGPRLNNLNGDPIVRPDGTTVEPIDGKPVPAVDRTGGPYSYQYGHTWKVDELSQEELEAIEAAERGQ